MLKLTCSLSGVCTYPNSKLNYIKIKLESDDAPSNVFGCFLLDSLKTSRNKKHVRILECLVKTLN